MREGDAEGARCGAELANGDRERRDAAPHKTKGAAGNFYAPSAEQNAF